MGLNFDNEYIIYAVACEWIFLIATICLALFVVFMVSSMLTGCVSHQTLCEKDISEYEPICFKIWQAMLIYRLKTYCVTIGEYCDVETFACFWASPLVL